MGEGAFHDLTLRDVVTIFKCKNTHSNGLTKNTQITVIVGRDTVQKKIVHFISHILSFSIRNKITNNHRPT